MINCMNSNIEEGTTTRYILACESTPTWNSTSTHGHRSSIIYLTKPSIINETFEVQGSGAETRCQANLQYSLVFLGDVCHRLSFGNVDCHWLLTQYMTIGFHGCYRRFSMKSIRRANTYSLNFIDFKEIFPISKNVRYIKPICCIFSNFGFNVSNSDYMNVFNFLIIRNMNTACDTSRSNNPNFDLFQKLLHLQKN